jgi:hypothetical protein
MISCSKTDTIKFISEYSDETVKYVINLDQSGMKITGYAKYINDALFAITSFENTDTTMIVLTRDSADRIINKKIFNIKNSELAESCLDSSFNEDGLYIVRSFYEYFDDFLVSSAIEWEQTGDYPGSGEALRTQVIENENIKSIYTAAPGNPGGCTNFFDHNSRINKIDVRNFSNGITGRISKNLIEHASWNNGCPGGPSSSIAYSDYQYEINQEGYVTKMTEIYTPVYHLSFSEEVTRTISTTIYEYNFP